MRIHILTRYSLAAAGAAIALVAAGCSSSGAAHTSGSSTESPGGNSTPAASGSTGGGETGSMGGTVAFLLPDNTTPRWTGQDAPAFKAALKRADPSATVIIDVANASPATQLAQAQAALTRGAKVLVVVPVDGTQAASIVTAAQKVNVPVIAYTRQINNADVKYMIGDDPHDIGVQLGTWMKDHTKQGDTIAVINGSPTDSFAHQEQAGYMGILKPLFDSGARHMVGDVWTPDWQPSNARSEMAALLVKTHNNIQAVLSANDGMAASIIAALDTVGLAGKIPVTGIDATLASDQLILKGMQSMTVWRSIQTEAELTATVVTDLLNGKEPPAGFFTSTSNNGRVDVPLKAVPSVVITKDNMDQLITSGAYTKADLCKGMPAGAGPCS